MLSLHGCISVLGLILNFVLTNESSYVADIVVFCSKSFLVLNKMPFPFPKEIGPRTVLSYLGQGTENFNEELQILNNIHSCLHIKLKVPICIASRCANIQKSCKASHFLVLNWTKSPDSGHNQNLRVQFPLIASQLTVLNGRDGSGPKSRCLQLPLNYLQKFNLVDFERKLRTEETFISSFKSQHKNCLLNNRHNCVLKIIIEILNLTFACADDTNDVNSSLIRQPDIQFTETNLLSSHSNNQRELFDPHEVYSIKFASKYKTSKRSLIYNLVRPIGWRVFTATLVLLPTITFILVVASKVSDSTPPSASQIFSVVFRPIFNQCEESFRKFPSTRLYFRMILITWLYYCLIVTDTYRSELISYTTQPIIKYWHSQFDEILTNQSISSPAVVVGSRPGQDVYFWTIISSEKEFSFTQRRHNKYKGLLEWMAKSIDGYVRQNRSIPHDVRSGEGIVIGQDVMVNAFSEACQKRLGTWYYKPSRDSLNTGIFWVLNEGRFQKEIVKILQSVRDSGMIDWFRETQDKIDGAQYQKDVQGIFAKEIPADLHPDFRPVYASLKFLHIKAITFLMLVGLVASAFTWTLELIWYWCFHCSFCSPITTTRVEPKKSVANDEEILVVDNIENKEKFKNCLTQET